MDNNFSKVFKDFNIGKKELAFSRTKILKLNKMKILFAITEILLALPFQT